MNANFSPLSLSAALASALVFASYGAAQNDRNSNQDGQANRMAEQDRSQHHATCSVCGLTVERASGAQQGLRVVDIQSGSPAAEANIQRGDLVVAIDEEPVDSPDQMQRLMRKVQRQSRPEDVRVRLRRDERLRQVTLTLDPGSRENQRQAGTRPGGTKQRDQQASAGDGRTRPSEEEARQREAALGVTLDASPQRLGHGVRIISVFANSPADRAGLMTGDRIVRVNGQLVSSHYDLIRRIESMDPDDEAEFTVIQDGREEELDIVLASQAETIQRAMVGRSRFSDRPERQARQGDSSQRYRSEQAGQGEQMTAVEQRLEEMQRELDRLRQRVREMEGESQRFGQEGQRGDASNQDRYAERTNHNRVDNPSRYDGFESGRRDDSNSDRGDR